MSITFQQAKEIALNHIESFDMPPEIQIDGNRMILLEDEIIEKDYGWIFSWSPSKFIETDDSRYAAFSNNPFLVLKENGNLIEFASAYTIDENINQYEKRYLKVD